MSVVIYDNSLENELFEAFDVAISKAMETREYCTKKRLDNIIDNHHWLAMQLTDILELVDIARILYKTSEPKAARRLLAIARSTVAVFMAPIPPRRFSKYDNRTHFENFEKYIDEVETYRKHQADVRKALKACQDILDKIIETIKEYSVE